MRDYKYIEQLLERYWECQTTLEEESILRTFFAQDEIPMHLLPYRQLFIAQKEEKETVLLRQVPDGVVEQPPGASPKESLSPTDLCPLWKGV